MIVIIYDFYPILFGTQSKTNGNGPYLLMVEDSTKMRFICAVTENIGYLENAVVELHKM